MQTPPTDEIPDWFLGSPIRVIGFEIGEFTIDAEVHHSLKPEFDPADMPKVVALHRVVRTDGEPLGDQPIRIDLAALAFDALFFAADLVMVPQETPGDPDLVMYGPGTASDWRKAAGGIRRVAGATGIRWTTQSDRWLIDTWRHLLASGHGTQEDLAEELGTTAKQISARLRMLRTKFGSERVPEGRRGRPSKEKGPRP
jgi:hypothetical protein